MMCDADCARLIPVKSPSAEEEDIDVARERQRVRGGRAQSDLLRICDLTKVAHYFSAVVPLKVQCITFAMIL